MSTLDDDLDNDLGLVAGGELSREELLASHGAGADQLLDIHEQLSQLTTIEIEPPPWYLVGPQLGAEPQPVRRRKRSVVAGIAVALVLIPATAEGIEAIAPDAVEGTVIDRITDILPWDEGTPIPATDRPTDRESDVPPIVDGSDEPVRTDEPVRDPDSIVGSDRTTTTVTDRERFVDRLRDRDQAREELLPDRRRDIDPSEPIPERRERDRRDGVDATTTTVVDTPTTTEAARDAEAGRLAETSTTTSATTTTTTTGADRVRGEDDSRGG